MRFWRARAKKFLAKPEAKLDKPPLTEIQKLVHELQTHQVELDMQNEELCRAQGEAEAAGVKYADLFDFAPIGYFIFTRQGLILEANLTGARLLGAERGSLLRTPFSFQVLPAFRPEFTAHLKKVFTTQSRQSCTLQLATQAGSALHVAMESVAVEGQGKGLAQCRSAFIDITARKLAEDNLKASEASYRAIFDNANDAIFIHDAANGAILDANRKMEAMYGYTAEEARNLRVGEISSGQPPYTQDYALARIRQAAAGEPQMFDWLCKDKNGSVFWVEVSLKRGVIGGQDRVLAIVRDHTARKQAEEEIKTTCAFLENIIDSSADPIWIVDEHGHFTRWNQAAAEVYGYRAENLAGQTAFDLYADKKALDKMLGHLRREGFVRGYEIDIRKKDGAIAPFSLSIRLFRDEGGKSTGSVCVARDLSEPRKCLVKVNLINARLQGLVQEADQRNRELTIINSMAEKLQSCLSLDEAYPLIAQHAQGLFPAKSGALFIHDPSTNLVEAVSTWGDAVAGEPVFPPTDCSALQHGRIAWEVALAGRCVAGICPPDTRAIIYVCLCWPRARPWGCCMSMTSAT